MTHFNGIGGKAILFAWMSLFLLLNVKKVPCSGCAESDTREMLWHSSADGGKFITLNQSLTNAQRSMICVDTMRSQSLSSIQPAQDSDVSPEAFSAH